jgi:hypothetical protein
MEKYDNEFHRNNVGRLGLNSFEVEHSLLAGNCEEGSESECRIEGGEFPCDLARCQSVNEQSALLYY